MQFAWCHRLGIWTDVSTDSRLSFYSFLHSSAIEAVCAPNEAARAPTAAFFYADHGSSDVVQRFPPARALVCFNPSSSPSSPRNPTRQTRNIRRANLVPALALALALTPSPALTLALAPTLILGVTRIQTRIHTLGR